MVFVESNLLARQCEACCLAGCLQLAGPQHFIIRPAGGLALLSGRGARAVAQPGLCRAWRATKLSTRHVWRRGPRSAHRATRATPRHAPRILGDAGCAMRAPRACGRIRHIRRCRRSSPATRDFVVGPADPARGPLPASPRPRPAPRRRRRRQQQRPRGGAVAVFLAQRPRTRGGGAGPGGQYCSAPRPRGAPRGQAPQRQRARRDAYPQRR